MRKEGLRIDDDLTRLRQEERSALDPDFKSFTTKGYKPLFIGSQLMYYHNDKAHICKKGRADLDAIPSA